MRHRYVFFVAMLLLGCQNPSTSQAFKAHPGAIDLDRFFQHGPRDLLPCKLVLTADIPIQRIGFKLFVQARINGSTANFVFDTGAVQSLITPEAANHLGLRLVSKNGSTFNGVGGSRKAAIYRADTVEFGLLHAAAWNFSVADFGMPPGTEIAGLIGADILRDYDIDLDLPAGRIRLFYAEHDCSHPSAFLNAPLFEVPLAKVAETHVMGRQTIQFVYSPNSPTLAIGIGGKQFDAVIDTGAPSNTMFRQGFEALGITREDVLAHRGADQRGIGAGVVAASVRTLESLDIGDLEIRNTKVSMVDQESPTGLPEIILGLQLIERIHMWISHSSNTLIMQYPPSPSPPITQNP